MDKPMDLSSPNSSHLSSDSGFDRKMHQPVSMEQMQWLLQVLSTSDRNALGAEMRKCTSGIIVTRGLPLAAVVMGSMYYARQRLPTQYHFGPKGWPFYALIGFGSMSLSILFSANSCSERIKPLLVQMYNKYSSAAPTPANTYASLRSANRARLGDASGSSLIPPESSGRRYDLTSDAAADYKQPSSPFSGNNTSSQYGDYLSKRRPPAVGSTNWIGTVDGLAEEDASLMSGTPYSNPSNVTHGYAQSSEISAKNQYGDAGFS